MSMMLHGVERGDTTKPPLLMLHGFMGAHDDWEPIIDSLCEDYRCLAVDLPGHGRTPFAGDPAAYTFAGAADLVRAFLQQRGVGSAHVLGYSMGGRLALYMAAHHPDVCDRVVVESASPGLLDKHMAGARVQQDGRWATRFETEPMETVLRDWYRQPVFASLQERPEVLEAMMRRRMNNCPAEIARAMRGFSVGIQAPLWAALPDMSRDVLVLVGEKDGKYLQVAERMAQSGPRVGVAVIPEAGHNAHCEQPDEFARVCREWFSGKEWPT